MRGLATIGVPYRVVTYLVETERLTPTQVVGGRNCFNRKALRQLLMLLKLRELEAPLRTVRGEDLDMIKLDTSDGVCTEVISAGEMIVSIPYDNFMDDFSDFMAAVQEGQSK
jgi:hypothetical protein